MSCPQVTLVVTSCQQNFEARLGRVKNSAWRSAGARDRPNAYAAPLTLRGPGDGPRLCGVSTDLARLLFGQDRVAAGDGTYRHTLELEAAEGALRYLQEQLPADSPDLATLASAVRAARAIHDLRRTPIFQQAREDAPEVLRHHAPPRACAPLPGLAPTRSAPQGGAGVTFRSFEEVVGASEGLAEELRGLTPPLPLVPFADDLSRRVRESVAALQRMLPGRLRNRQTILLGAIGPALSALRECRNAGYPLPDDLAALVAVAESAGMLRDLSAPSAPR